MRILYASERPPYPYFLGGAARCAHRLLVSLAQEQGVQCLAVGSADYAVSPWAVPQPGDFAALGVRGVQPNGTLDCGYPVQVLTGFPGALSDLIDRFRPDVVWSQLEGAQAVLALARAKGITGLLYVHDAEDPPAALRATAALGCHVVCSSAFLADRVAAVIGRPTHVLYPASDWCFGTVGDPAGCITLVNPHPVKGLDTFLAIARQLPEQRFLLQESWKLDDTALAKLQARLADLPNLRLQRRVSDMRAVYAQTRLLLAPSVWEEGFGMVVVEAQSCGIPVIASARGGLPESVGSGGVLIQDYRNVNAWVEAVRTLCDDGQRYQDMSARALAHARSDTLNVTHSAQCFVEVCRGSAPRVPGRVGRLLGTARRRVVAFGRRAQGG
ncbi:MAG: glycosyltransferase [Betaproteobacteria bacterium]|nr:glycosyltransferase [Betaproteobacteria bacterium]